MRRSWTLLIILVLLSLACRAVIPETLALPLAPATLPAATSPAPFPTTEPRTLPPPASTPLPLPIPDTSFKVRLHPDGNLYVGDQVSLEVIVPQEFDTAGHSAQVQVDAPEGTNLGAVEFGRYGIGGRFQATLLWAWDTSGLEAGQHTLTVSILPEGLSWTETVTLQPQSEVPPPEPQAEWAEVETECCTIHYITGTEAERDLEYLVKMADEQAREARERLDVEQADRMQVTFLPRVLGHGGFTSQEIAVSYLDRNYAGSSPEIVLHHEMIHLLDSRLGGDLRPTLLVEGLAVYLTGGHFKPEPLMPRAAALLAPVTGCMQAPPSGNAADSRQARPACALNLYISLGNLADNFYFSQHEIGYLEAGALIEYMVDTWGWQAYSDFYRDIHSQPNGGQSQAIDAALKEHFDISLAELEKQFLQALREQSLTPELVEDVRLSVDFYDTVRRYQRILDPSAYFLTAWLPDSEQMRQRGIVADYLRHPLAPENRALETLLVAADTSLQNGDYARTRQMLDSINAVLDVFSEGGAILQQGHGGEVIRR